jgi:hypothetical protein
MTMTIKDELQEEIWSPIAVQAVLASKANKREQKGRGLNAAISISHQNLFRALDHDGYHCHTFSRRADDKY